MGKIFCIGFQKTGTTSLEAALIQLGYKVCGVRYDLIEAVRKNDMQTIRAVVDAYDAVQDNPWPLLYKELDQSYPGSKFILTTRDEEAWYRSVLNHFNSTPSQMQELIYHRPYPEGHKELFLATYIEHNQAVQNYFADRPSDLLVTDLTKNPDWKTLCDFLQVPIPDIPFPHANKGAYTWYGKIWKYLWKRIRARYNRYFS